MIRALTLVILSGLLLLTSCSNKSGTAQTSGTAKQKLYIYNWTYYIPDTVLKEFEKRFNATIVYDMYASNEEMFAKLKAGGTGYDIVFPSGDYVSIMARENMIDTLDKTKIQNFANLDTSVLKKINFDKGCVHSVPYIMGAAGISVNKKLVGSYDKSWSVFDKKELKGRMTLLDDMREVLGGALKTLGYSVNTTNPDELAKAKTIVLRWRENIVKFDAEAFAKGFAAGEFYVVHGYAENVFLELDSNQRKDVDFFIPKEGSAMYMDNMVLLKDAKNKELAYKFMNFIHEPEIFAQVVDFLMLPSINVPARAIRKVKPNYEISDLVNSEFKEDLGQNLELYNSIWNEIRIGK
jgi:spermidine/putrescine transport system substrate-binding protein